MVEHCILWLHPDGTAPANGDACRWLVLDAQGNRVGHPQQGSVEEAANICAQRKTTLLLPGERIHALNASIPGKNPQKLLQAAPYALEDRFAEDVDELHFALLERHGNEQRFLVVDRNWFAGILQRLAEYDIRPLRALPDYLGVEAESGHEHWVITESRLLARTRDEAGFAADIQYAAGLWPGSDDEPAPHITVQDGVDLQKYLGQKHLEQEQHGAIALETLTSDTLFTRMARTAINQASPGLLQGEFRSRKESNEKFRRWRPAAALAATLMLVLAVGWGVDVWRLNSELAALEQQAERQFSRILPNSRMGRDPVGQIKSALKGGASQENLALDMIAALGLGLEETGEARLQAFSFRGKRLEFSVMVKDAEKLEALRQSLESRGRLQVSIASANAVATAQANGQGDSQGDYQGYSLEGRLTMEATGQ